MNLPDRLFNLPPSKEGQDSDSPADVATENALFPSNDNIACAMEESKDFCEYYGKEVEQRRVSEIFTEVHEDDARLKLEEENLEAYRSAVSQLTT
ncbi:hypothetical protein JCM33374_g2209 [Metschnikowia sp. JCM 33374]|nr:hypothetical protein JCM33374_g2209 [Metschnikowia sp. JCM 33374]